MNGVRLKIQNMGGDPINLTRVKVLINGKEVNFYAEKEILNVGDVMYTESIKEKGRKNIQIIYVPTNVILLNEVLSC